MVSGLALRLAVPTFSAAVSSSSDVRCKRRRTKRAEVGAGAGANSRSLPPLALKTGTPLFPNPPRPLGSADCRELLQSRNDTPALS